jgi:hypothetical protein
MLTDIECVMVEDCGETYLQLLTIRLPREQRREGIKICAKREKDER